MRDDGNGLILATREQFVRVVGGLAKGPIHGTVIDRLRREPEKEQEERVIEE